MKYVRIALTIFIFTLIYTQILTAQTENLSGFQGFEEVKLKNKIIPLDNTVYKLLDFYESSGIIGFLPQAKPYTKSVVLELLSRIKNSDNLTERQREIISGYIDDFSRESNAVQVYKKSTENTFSMIGAGAESTFGKGFGENTTWKTSHLAKPFLSGDLGQHISFHATLGAAIEKLAPDLFFESYTKDKKVNFPFESFGYAHLPYQFNYETLTSHSALSDQKITTSYFTSGLAVGWTHFSELNGSWFNSALQVSLNNQRRSWGHDFQNLVLSSTARRFPALEMKVEPASWIRYSFLTGSLFSYNNQSPGYKKDIYGYDLGDVQKNFTLHLLEFTPSKWLQVSAGAGNIWSKRFEMAYLLPFSPFAQLEVGDQDNMYINFDIAVSIPSVGKTWFSGFIDEFSFDIPENAFKMPRNRYAWQWGFKTAAISGILPGTTALLKYSRITPFVYTHYPDDNFNQFSTRPVDLTYTHDGFNLGFYLPPNSGEFNLKLDNIAIPDLTLTFDSKLIMHGTNDLSSSNVYQVYGDIYRHQLGEDIYKYPLLDFKNDGIYDFSILSDFRFDWKIRNFVNFLRYFRLNGGLGYAKTWWKSNQSNVIAPDSRKILTGNLGIVVDI